MDVLDYINNGHIGCLNSDKLDFNGEQFYDPSTGYNTCHNWNDAYTTFRAVLDAHSKAIYELAMANKAMFINEVYYNDVDGVETEVYTGICLKENGTELFIDAFNDLRIKMLHFRKNALMFWNCIVPDADKKTNIQLFSVLNKRISYTDPPETVGNKIRPELGNKSIIDVIGNVLINFLPDIRLSSPYQTWTMPDPGSTGDFFLFVNHLGERTLYGWNPDINNWDQTLGNLIVNYAAPKERFPGDEQLFVERTNNSIDARAWEWRIIEYSIDFSKCTVLTDEIYKNYINSFFDYLFSIKNFLKVTTDSNFEKVSKTEFNQIFSL